MFKGLVVINQVLLLYHVACATKSEPRNQVNDKSNNVFERAFKGIL